MLVRRPQNPVIAAKKKQYSALLSLKPHKPCGRTSLAGDLDPARLRIPICNGGLEALQVHSIAQSREDACTTDSAPLACAPHSPMSSNMMLARGEKRCSSNPRESTSQAYDSERLLFVSCTADAKEASTCRQYSLGFCECAKEHASEIENSPNEL